LSDSTLLTSKLGFYERHGVEEYYIYDPDTNDLQGWQRQQERLAAIPSMQDWVSDRLGIRFDLADGSTLRIYERLGKPFLTFDEVSQRLETTEERLEIAEESRQRMVQKLRELGIDPDSL
jgi:hypothetical protein